MEVNPYAPPQSPLYASDPRSGPDAEVDERFWSIIGGALALFGRHVVPIAAIVLLVRLPANLLVEYLTYEVFGPDDFLSPMRVDMSIEGFLAPFYISGVLCLLFAVRRGESASASRALREATSIWPRVFLARLVSGLAILVGLVALVIPGLYLAVRFALVDAVVVNERLAPRAALSRSWELSEGRFWRIAGSFVLMMMVPTVSAGLVGVMLGLWSPLDGWVPAAILDCPIDVLFELVTVLAFLFYCAATKQESDAASASQAP